MARLWHQDTMFIVTWLQTGGCWAGEVVQSLPSAVIGGQGGRGGVNCDAGEAVMHPQHTAKMR